MAQKNQAGGPRMDEKWFGQKYIVHFSFSELHVGKPGLLVPGSFSTFSFPTPYPPFANLPAGNLEKGEGGVNLDVIS